MADLGIERGYVVNLSPKPVDLRRSVRMLGLTHLLDELRLRPPSRTASS